MRKWYLFIIAVLTVVLVGALIACWNLKQTTDLPVMQTEPSVEQGTDPAESKDPAAEVTEPSAEPDPTWMTFPADRALKAQQYFVYDCELESFTVISGGENDRIYPASITKLFTAYMALQYLDVDTEITAGDVLELIAPGSSVAQIEKDNVLTVGMLIEAMLLPSGNDAAYILAAEVGRRLDDDPNEGAWYAVETFMREANDNAQALDMTGTHFVNPDGIHSDDHYMTPRDLVMMARLALELPEVVTYATTARDTVTFASGEEREWKNTNALVDADSPYYCPFAVGLKTGQTPYAGSCLLSAFQVEGKTLIIGVFGCPEIDDRFEDTLQLFTEAVNASGLG